jgi:phosphatidylserine decarboxylase
MKFHKEGRISLILAISVSIVLLVMATYGFTDHSISQPIAMLLAAFLLITILQFFRNPSRKMLQMSDSIIAPADGKIVVIEEVEDTEYFHKKVKQISIFMSPTNVHINWYPISGEVVYSKYHPGKYLVAWHPKSSTDNERHSVVIKHPVHGEVLVKQVAGALARRIVNYSKANSQIEQGEEMGFIKFGSRVDLLIPLDANVDVSSKQKSIGGSTIIASFKK